ncbi:MAG: hypothetical protein GX442_17245 [Candidatus Riflebacteria bacterium]|nr:hypothetical protein [Candidatus Riflebacteria bacterium]
MRPAPPEPSRPLLAGLAAAAGSALLPSPVFATTGNLDAGLGPGTGFLLVLVGVLLGGVLVRLGRRPAVQAPLQASLEFMNEVPIPLAIFGPEQRPVLWNRAMQRLTGLTKAEVAASGPADIPAFGPHSEITRALQSLAGNPSPEGFLQLNATFYSGALRRQVPVQALLVRTPADGAGGSRIILTLHDLTELDGLRQQHQQALAEAQSSVKKLAEIDRLKSEFLAICSHELKTPLVSITGYLDLMGSQKLGPLTPRQENALRVSLRNAGRLNELLGSLLDLARMEAGKMQFEFTPQRLGPMLEEILAVVHPMLESKRLTLTVDSPPDLPYVVLDPSMLNRVFLNLLDNAIKFTPSGGTIAIRAVAAEEAVHVEVTDSGTGIPPADLERVKAPFFQSDASDTRRAGGLGLGLAIVEKILIGHGTRLTLENRPGGGTRAGFSLKVAKRGSSGKFIVGDPTQPSARQDPPGPSGGQAVPPAAS